MRAGHFIRLGHLFFFLVFISGMVTQSLDMLVDQYLLSRDEEASLLQAMTGETRTSENEDDDEQAQNDQTPETLLPPVAIPPPATASPPLAPWMRCLVGLRLHRQDLRFSLEQRMRPVSTVAEGRLRHNPDVLSHEADLALTQHDGPLARKISRRVLAFDPFHKACLITHASALFEAGETTDLFHVAHRRAEVAPKGASEDGKFVLVFLRYIHVHCECILSAVTDATTWFIIGCYYLASHRPDSAADAFEKSTHLDNRLALSWVGLGRAAAQREESDRAMAAYRTASRLFPAWHQPYVSLAVEAQRAQSQELARLVRQRSGPAHDLSCPGCIIFSLPRFLLCCFPWQFLEQARSMCPTEPLIYNELGTLQYKCVMDCVFALPPPTIGGCQWHYPLTFCMRTVRRRGAYREALGLFQFVINLVEHIPLVRQKTPVRLVWFGVVHSFLAARV